MRANNRKAEDDASPKLKTLASSSFELYLENTKFGGRIPMGAFLLGLIIGAAGALILFIYDEGEIFLKLGRQIKAVSERYKQQRAG